MLIGAVTLGLAVLIWLVVRNRPEDKGLPPMPDAMDGPSGAEAYSLAQGMKLVLTGAAGRFWALAVWFFFALGVFFSMGGLWGGALPHADLRPHPSPRPEACCP